MREFLDPNHYLEAADDAEMIQSAVDFAARTGEAVTVPRHNLRTGKDIWILPRAVLLNSGTILRLDNCHLRQADGIFDNMFRNSNGRTERAAEQAGRQYDIQIVGLGHAVLDGGNHNGLVERNAGRDGRPPIIVNTTIHLHNCERILLDNLNIIHQRWWGITFHYCSAGRVSNIRFMSIGNAPNADGVDLRTGCTGFVIENISGYTQDDSVALTCLDHGTDARMRVAGMDDSIHNVIVRNVTTATRCAQVRLLNQDGKRVYNVIVEDIQNGCEIDPRDPGAEGYALRIPFSKDYKLESETSMALAEPYWGTFRDGQRPGAGVRIGDDWYFKDNDPAYRAKPGDMFNITVRNVQSRAQYGVTVACALSDALIENIQMFGDALTPVYFGPGRYDAVRVRDIGCAWNTMPPQTDLDSVKEEKESLGRYGCSLPACVFFNGSHAGVLTFEGVRASSFHEAVFAGKDCDVTIRVRDAEVRGREIPLIGGKGIRLHSAVHASAQKV